MIIMHIVAYLVIIIVNLLCVAYGRGGLRAFEISVICYLTIYSICTVIFGLIVD
jgi:hypothetical protein